MTPLPLVESRSSSDNPFRRPAATPLVGRPMADGMLQPLVLPPRQLSELTSSQAAALATLAAWVNQPTEQIFRLFGAAGTGKTHIIGLLLKLFPRLKFALVTLSGKAALVLQRAHGIPSQTIHSMLYVLEGMAGDGELLFRPDADHVARQADIIVVDEASMVGLKMRADLFRLN